MKKWRPKETPQKNLNNNLGRKLHLLNNNLRKNIKVLLEKRDNSRNKMLIKMSKNLL